MKLTVEIDSVAYSNALSAFVRELKADSVLLLKEEMRLLLRDIVDFTPPFSYQQGRNAIKGDLFGGRRKVQARYASIGLFQRIGSSRLIPPKRRPKTANATPETVAVRLGWEQAKKIRIYAKYWRPNATIEEMRAFHKRYQNPNTGRVGFVSQSMIGRQKVQDQMWVSNAAANTYFRLLADRVGLARAGWARAALGVGLPLRKWVMRHIAYAKGIYTPPTVNSLEIEAVNRSFKIPNYYQRHVLPAIQSRVRSLVSEAGRLIRRGGKSRRASLANTPSGKPN